MCAYDKTFNLLKSTTLILNPKAALSCGVYYSRRGEEVAKNLESNYILPQKLLRYFKAVLSKIFLREHHH
jgi:hypothetical protein